MLFSDGAGGAPPPVVAGVVAVVVVVVVVVVSGAFSPLAQAAVIAPIAMIAEAPEIAASRRPKRRESMVQSYLWS
jgi:Na+/melibiose symporter-like transporter